MVVLDIALSNSTQPQYVPPCTISAAAVRRIVFTSLSRQHCPHKEWSLEIIASRVVGSLSYGELGLTDISLTTRPSSELSMMIILGPRPPAT